MRNVAGDRLVVLSALLLLVSGCAGTKLVSPRPSLQDQAEVSARLRTLLDPSRHTTRSEMKKVVQRVDDRIRAAAIRVCQRTFNDPHNCPTRLNSRSLQVLSEVSLVNAYVGLNYDLTILGGLVAAVGSDDELAAVLGHEYAHALMGHVHKSLQNSALVALVGFAAGATIGATVDRDSLGDWMQIGQAVGTRIGQLVFSKGMEFEADHLAVFMVHEASYDMEKAGNVFIRLERIQRNRTQLGIEGVVGFLETHPGGPERVQKWLATEKLIERGFDSPVWKPQGR